MNNIINAAPIVGNFFNFIDVAAIVDRYHTAFKNSPGERYLTEVRGILIFDYATGTTANGVDTYHFGYCPSYNYNGDGRLIIPSMFPAITAAKFLTAEAVHNRPAFKARSIRPDCPPQYKIMVNKGGSHFTWPGNWCEELDATGESLPEPCLVFEGEIDAVTAKAIDPYAKAVSMGNAHRDKAFVGDLLRLRSLGVPFRPLWLIPDNDKNGTGDAAMIKLSATLTEYGFLHCWKGDSGAPVELDLLRETPYKDINELWLNDKRLATKRFIDGSVVATDFVKLWGGI